MEIGFVVLSAKFVQNLGAVLMRKKIPVN